MPDREMASQRRDVANVMVQGLEIKGYPTVCGRVLKYIPQRLKGRTSPRLKQLSQASSPPPHFVLPSWVLKRQRQAWG